MNDQAIQLGKHWRSKVKSSAKESFHPAGIAFVFCLVLQACGGSGYGDSIDPPRITTITVSPSEVTLEALGAIAQLEANARDQNGDFLTTEFSWSSSDTVVATVDADGVVSAVNNGTATVTARSGPISAFAVVTVEQAPARIMLSSDEITFAALGEQQVLEASVFDANDRPMSAELVWDSSEPSVASVDRDGRITAQANGIATVRVTSGSISHSVTITVRQAVSKIELVPVDVTLTAIGQRFQFAATALDANGQPLDAAISFRSSEPLVASINDSGMVIARRNGTVTLTANTGMVSGSVKVTVDQQVASVSIAPPDTDALDAIGDSVQLRATARDANGHAVSVEFNWASSDLSIATVDATGLVTAHGHGAADITASAGNLSYVVTLNVSLYPAVVVTPASSMLESFGAAAQLKARVLDADGQEISAEVDWASSDSAIAVVDAAGLVTARGNGTVTISARSGDLSGTASVRVLQVVRHIRVTPEGPFQDPVLFISLGETVQFTAMGLDGKGNEVSGATFTASPRENGVVTIDDDLLATAVGNGDTVIDFTTRWAGNATRWPNAVRVRQVAASLEIEPSARSFRHVDETHQFAAAARDANNHSMPADFLYWESADRRVAVVDDTGLVSITGVGDTKVRVFTVEGISASATVSGDLQTTCETGDRIPSISSVNPSPLVEGASFAIQGMGFCGESAGNLVTVDRMVATVEALSETRLSVTVPQFDCLPSRRVAVTVSVGENRTTSNVELKPDEAVVPQAVGRQTIWGAAEERCLQFPEAVAEEAYLIGVQSTSLSYTSSELTPVRLIASTSEAGASDVIAEEQQQSFWNTRQAGVPGTASVTFHSADQSAPDEPLFEVPFVPIEVHAEQDESKVVAPIPADTVTFPQSGDIESLPEEGDTVMIAGLPVEWLVYKTGTHALWLVDSDFVERMEARYPGRLEDLSESFDGKVYPVISEYFGAPDLGNLDRVVVTVSTEYGPAGASGNAGRQWHRMTVGLLHGLDIVAHEFVHVVQQAGAWGGAHPRGIAPSWFIEAQAQLGTEQYGLVETNRTTAQNYGSEVAFDRPGGTSIAWDLNFHRIGYFFGGPHPERPQECSWLINDPAPCFGMSLYYHVGWSLLRWLADQYGRMYPGGEANLQRELIHGPNDVIETIEQQMGEPMETLLARWAAALYVDDRIPNLDPDLEFTTWDFHDIYRDDPDRLMPLRIPFSDQEWTARIREGSFWYVHVSGSHRPSVAIRVRDLADRDPSDEIQVWIVRLQ